MKLEKRKNGNERIQDITERNFRESFCSAFGQRELFEQVSSWHITLSNWCTDTIRAINCNDFAYAPTDIIWETRISSVPMLLRECKTELVKVCIVSEFRLPSLHLRIDFFCFTYLSCLLRPPPFFAARILAVETCFRSRREWRERVIPSVRRHSHRCSFHRKLNLCKRFSFMSSNVSDSSNSLYAQTKRL